jgi:hypothetical protein
MPDDFARAPAPRQRRCWKTTTALVAAALVASTLSLLGARTAYAGAGTATLNPGESLSVGQGLVSNQRGANNYGFTLWVQGDGNVVLYAPAPDSAALGRALWSTGTAGQSLSGLFMQGDGNLVLKNSAGTVIWNTYTWGHNGAYLALQDDGTLVISPPGGGAPLWNDGVWYGANGASFGMAAPGVPYYGTCLSTTNYICRNTWTSSNRTVYFRAYDQFSPAENWKADAQAAVDAWNNAPGPQWYCLYPENACGTNDTYIYLIDNSTGQYDLGSQSWGITWNCYVGRNPQCTDNQQSGTVQWSEAHLNRDKLNGVGATSADRQHTIGHESGHGMLLAHNPIDANALMYPKHNTRSVGPNNNDIGGSSTCANGGFGMRCIYGSG